MKEFQLALVHLKKRQIKLISLRGFDSKLKFIHENYSYQSITTKISPQ